MTIAVIIPCFRTGPQTVEVIRKIDASIAHIYVVDDACPLRTADLVESEFSGGRVTVVRHETNRGVGGAMVSGYEAALAGGHDIFVKLDGDGQMDPGLIPQLVAPLVAGACDYRKGNRFHELRDLRSMPLVRLVGNTALSFINKVVSGYWTVMDPTNGFTAIHKRALQQINLSALAPGFFFESDMLVQLYLARAVVSDMPMRSQYGEENSNLRVLQVLLRFPSKYVLRFFRRVFYTYYVRDFNACSLNLSLGLIFVGFGVAFGLRHWWQSVDTGIVASSGTVMVATLPIILGWQMLLAALQFDFANVPVRPLQRES